MTKEEIKETYSMRDIAARYGLAPNRAGFICCPFHKGDHEASLKVYKQDYHCFGCGANGDIFDFVMRMDGLTFQEAFLALGGTWDRPTFSSRLKIYQAQKAREMQRKEEERLREERKWNCVWITIYRKFLRRVEPMSDAWCDLYNALFRELLRHEFLNGMG